MGTFKYIGDAFETSTEIANTFKYKSFKYTSNAFGRSTEIAEFFKYASFNYSGTSTEIAGTFKRSSNAFGTSTEIAAPLNRRVKLLGRVRKSRHLWKCE